MTERQNLGDKKDIIFEGQKDIITLVFSSKFTYMGE